jgi:hypothetical protein
LASRIAKYNDQTKQTAQATAAGAMPFEQTEAGQKLKLEAKEKKEAQATRYENFKTADGTVVAVDTNHYAPPPGSVKVGNTQTSGVPRVIGHTSIQDAMSLLDSGAMEYTLPNGEKLTKEQLQSFPPYMELTQIRQGDKDLYYPTDQRTHISTVGNVRYQVPEVGGVLGQTTPLGEARTPTSSTDPFGVTTTTAPSSPGITNSPPSSDTASPKPATKSTPGPKTKKLKEATNAAGKQLDATGHIPAGAANPGLVEAANSLIDGMDVTKLALPQKDRPAAMALAREYGWKGQGLFNPKEVLQLKEGATVIDNLLNSDALSVLDAGTLSKLPMIGQSANPSKSGTIGRVMTSISAGFESPKQQEFMRLWRQLDSLAIGLRGMVQAGRATQAQVDRIIAEFPNPYNTTSAEDAKRRLKLVQNELRVAAETGKLPDVPLGDKNEHKVGDTKTFRNGKSGVWDGHGWVEQ